MGSRESVRPGASRDGKLVFTAPLAGVFLAGLLIETVVSHRAFTANLPDVPASTVIVFGVYSLPLAVYAVLFRETAFLAGRGRSESPVWERIVSDLALFCVIILSFPWLTSAMAGVLAIVPWLWGLAAAPFAVGALFGGILSYAVPRPESWTTTHWFWHNAANAGAVGLLVFYAWSVLVLRFVPMAGDGGAGGGPLKLLISAIVLTLCYLPHYLAAGSTVTRRRTGGQGSRSEESRHGVC